MYLFLFQLIFIVWLIPTAPPANLLPLPRFFAIAISFVRTFRRFRQKKLELYLFAIISNKFHKKHSKEKQNNEMKEPQIENLGRTQNRGEFQAIHFFFLGKAARGEWK